MPKKHSHSHRRRTRHHRRRSHKKHHTRKHRGGRGDTLTTGASSVAAQLSPASFSSF